MKALETGTFLHRGSVGKPGGNSFTAFFERWTKEALETERLSLWELCEGNPVGGLLFLVF
jgi:hypothetical protein